MKYLIIALIFVLVGCEAPEPRERLTTEMQLSVHYVTASEMKHAAASNGDKTEGLEGYAVLRRDPWRCDIYLPQDGVSTAAQQLIGHELLHCVYGNYHD